MDLASHIVFALRQQVFVALVKDFETQQWQVKRKHHSEKHALNERHNWESHEQVRAEIVCFGSSQCHTADTVTEGVVALPYLNEVILSVFRSFVLLKEYTPLRTIQRHLFIKVIFNKHLQLSLVGVHSFGVFFDVTRLCDSLFKRHFFIIQISELHHNLIPELCMSLGKHMVHHFEPGICGDLSLHIRHTNIVYMRFARTNEACLVHGRHHLQSEDQGDDALVNEL